jgi:hypothetical protein
MPTNVASSARVCPSAALAKTVGIRLGEYRRRC